MPKTIEQIAEHLALSVTTVRLVLSGKAEKYRISVKTQKRIQEYVQQHGYTLNYAARSLKLNRTDTLALIVPNISNAFFATLVEKLEKRCRRSGYQLTISCSYQDVEYENKLVRAMINRNVDGLFIVPSSLENQLHHQNTVQKPLVLLDQNFKTGELPLVESNNVAGGEVLATQMLTNHETPLWFLLGDFALPSIIDRFQGYLHALQKQQIHHQNWVRIGTANTRECGFSLMTSLLVEHGVPHSFIASSIPMLEGAVNAIRAYSGSIPAEINMGTFDEHPMLDFLPNNVWSMQQDEDAWAENAFALMQKAINGEAEHSGIKVDMTLIQRVRQRG